MLQCTVWQQSSDGGSLSLVGLFMILCFSLLKATLQRERRTVTVTHIITCIIRGALCVSHYTKHTMCCIMMTTNRTCKQTTLGRVFLYIYVYIYIYSFPRMRGKRLSFCHISLQHPLSIFYPPSAPPRCPSSGCSAARPFVKASQCPSAITCCLCERVETDHSPL